MQQIRINARAVPTALREAVRTSTQLPAGVPELLEVSAQIIEQLIARDEKNARDMESLIRSFSPRTPYGRVGGS